MAKRNLALGMALGASVIFGGTANAALVEYTDRTTWLAAIGGATGGENFNGFGADVSFDGLSVALASGMTIGTQAATFPDYNVIDVAPLATTESDVNGTAHARVFNGPSDPGVFPFITFSSAVSAFGAEFQNLNDDILRSRVQVFDGATLLATLTPSIVAIDVVRFWGFAADAGETITEIRFLRVTNDVFGIDDIEIRAAVTVPEPATLGLFGLGLAGLGLARRRRTA